MRFQAFGTPFPGLLPASGSSLIAPRHLFSRTSAPVLPSAGFGWIAYSGHLNASAQTLSSRPSNDSWVATI
jgi:hypothetical protein